METFDPFAYAMAGIHLSVVFALSLVGTLLYAASRGGAWGRLRTALGQAKQMGRATYCDLAKATGAEFLIFSKGGTAGTVNAASGGNVDLKQVTRYVLVKDMDGQTGLVLTVGGKDVCISGLEQMARIYSLIQQDPNAHVQFVFRDDEGKSMERAFRRLDLKERDMVQGWLNEKETITDIIRGVDYEGKLKSSGAKGLATLVVTNLRVGLLARTVTSSQNRTTTHYNLISYLLPLAEKVAIERKASLGKPQFLVRLVLKDMDQNDDAPILKLTKDHTGILLPLVLFRRPVEVTDPPVGMGRVIAESILAGLGWGILFGGAGVGLGLALAEGESTFYYRFMIPIVIAGFFTPGIMRFFSISQAFVERARHQSAHRIA
ncbi:hypothetical protein OAX78_00035 [Planctomycetota bacterium]|nr:hypothetical protein [Planctomycetota bacterium]